MAAKVPNWTLGELAAAVGGQVRGDASLRISRPVPAGHPDPHGLTFAESPAFIAKALATEGGAVIVRMDAQVFEKSAILHPAPRVAFGQVLALYRRALPIAPGVHPTAVVSPGATIASDAMVGAFCVLEDGVRIEAGARIYAFCYIGQDCTVGPRSTLMPGVVLVQGVSVGADAILHPGVVIGADGFGFVWDGSMQRKVPQVGGVVLGDDVEVGANSTIDRATCGETTVGSGVKLDNLVQVGHNVKVGEHTVMAAQTGIGGSAVIGDRVTIAGQAGVADHKTIVDDTVLAARSGVINDIDKPGAYYGMPTIPAKEAMRIIVAQQRLPDLIRRLKALEREVEELKARAGVPSPDGP